METESLHTGLSGPALTGLLSRLALLDGPSVKPSFVQGLSHWLGWADAIALSAALQAPASAPARPMHASPVPAEREFERVRGLLLRAIDEHKPPAAARPGVAPQDEKDFEPHRQRYAALQLAMQAAIEPLRAQARAAVAQRSPAMRRLAALDAAMEPLLGGREQALLALLPTLLQTHFDRLRRAPTSGGRPWHEQFRQDIQRLLQAELELRLQPLQGLIDTLRSPSPEAS